MTDEEWSAMTDEQWLRHRIDRCTAEGWMANKQRYERLLSTSAAVRGMREALERIARPRDCGCVPCRGQCTSREALLIEAEAMRDIADAALAALSEQARGQGRSESTDTKGTSK